MPWYIQDIFYTVDRILDMQLLSKIYYRKFEPTKYITAYQLLITTTIILRSTKDES